MTGFRAEAVFFGFIASVMAAAAAAGPQAASAPPRLLTPGAPAAAPGTPAQPPVPNPGTPPRIIVRSLGDIDGPAVGLLDDTNGGLGQQMWTGSDHAVIEDLLARVPAGSNSVVVRNLSRRLLLTTADSPLGEKRRSLLTIRLEDLLNAGMLAEAGALASMASLKDDPDFARVQADALLYAQRKDDVCGPRTATRLSSSAPFWIELRAYCYAANGDDPALELTRAAMTAQNLDDKTFDTLLDDVVGGRSKNPGEIVAPSSLHVFLMLESNVPVSGAVAQKLGLPANIFAMREKRNPPDVRLDAAARALKAGSATAYDLIEVARAQKFSPGELANPVEAAQKMPFLAAEALLYQAINEAKEPAVKARILWAALELGENKGLLDVAANMHADAIGSIVADKNQRDVAPLMARAAMLTGKPDVAASWIATLDPDRDKSVLAALIATLDLIATAPARDVQAQAALVRLAGTNDARGALVLGVYDAIGLPMPPEANSVVPKLVKQPWPGRRPAAAQMQRLESALGNPERSGEAILTILDIIGAKGPGDLAPDVTIDLMQALRREGLTDVARRLGIEALLTFRLLPSKAAAK